MTFRVTVQCLGEVVAITFRKAEAWMPERASMRMDAHSSEKERDVTADLRWH